MKLTLVNQASRSVPRKFLNHWNEILTVELCRRRVMSRNMAAKELTLVFLDSAQAQALNYEFRGKNYPTDVLSFAALDESSLGELILCPEVLARQAKEHHLTYKQELGYMFLHGVLHLLGYDHETNEADAQKMFRLQDALFAKLLASHEET